MKIERLSPALGAIISGIDLNATLNGEAQQGLQAALVEHQVLFLRQQFLQAEQHHIGDQKLRRRLHHIAQATLGGHQFCCHQSRPACAQANAHSR